MTWLAQIFISVSIQLKNNLNNIKEIKFSLIIVSFLLLAGCTLISREYQLPTLDNQTALQAVNTLKNRLDLSNNDLDKVPAYVFTKTNLEELNLSNNRLTGAIPAEIRQLKNLKILNLSNNLMTGVPAEIGQLSNLIILDLSNNQLTGLPYELGNLKKLQTLNISGNKYSAQDLAVILRGLPPTVKVIK